MSSFPYGCFFLLVKQDGISMVTPDWVHGLCLFAVVGWLLDATVAVGLERFNLRIERFASSVIQVMERKNQAPRLVLLAFANE